MDYEDAFDSVIYSIIQSRMGQKTPINQLISSNTLLDLLESVQIELREEDTIIKLNGNIHVVGDIHGNIDDLLRIFEKSGFPPETTYLFLGDFVDRGKFGVEVLFLLFALKVKFPNHIYLLRGNHEIEKISSSYGFSDETASKYSFKLFSEIANTFSYLPLGAVVADKFFCVHGGIGPNMPLIEDIKKEEKPEDIDEGYFLDMLWSDPRDYEEEFTESKRGSGYYYNSKAVDNFLEQNGLIGLIRSHEYCKNGHDYPFDNDKCLTIFSNTNYCGKKNSMCIAFVAACGEIDLIEFPLLDNKQKETLRFTLPKWLAISALSSPINSSASSGLESDADESDYEHYSILKSSLYSAAFI